MSRRLLPLVVLAALALVLLASGAHRFLSLDLLAERYEDLRAWAGRHPVSAPLVFGLVYAAVVATSLPGATVLTLAGGLMFGVLLGTAVVVLAATVGATVVFLVARTALGEPLRRRTRGWLERLEAGFRDGALSYLLVLRLVPLFPFWLVNLAPAFLGVSARVYVLATLVGIVPGTLVYVSVGNGLGTVLAAGERPDLGLVLDPRILGPLLGLALLALVPVAYKRWRGGSAANATTATGAERLRTARPSDKTR